MIPSLFVARDQFLFERVTMKKFCILEGWVGFGLHFIAINKAGLVIFISRLS